MLKETSTLRQAGRTRKVVVTKTEVFYIPLLESLKAKLKNSTFLDEVQVYNYIHTGFFLCVWVWVW